MKDLQLKKQKSFKLRISRDMLENLPLFMLLCRDAVWSLLYHIAVTLGFGENTLLISIIHYTITILPYILSLATYRKIKKTGFFILLPVCFLLFVFSAELHPQYRTWIYAGDWPIWTTIFAPTCGLFMFLYVQANGKPDQIYKTVINSAWICIIYAFVRFVRVLIVGDTVMFTNGETFHNEYDMGLGYLALFYSVIFLYRFMQTDNKKDFIYFIICIVIIIFGGSRGPFGLLGVAFFVALFEFRKKLSRSKIIIILSPVLIGVLLIVLLNIKGIQTFLLKVVEDNGVHSRTLTMLFSGEIMFDNGRDALKIASRQLIKDGGFWGYGVYGDRYFLTNVMVSGYPHNIYYEMALQFGSVIAVVLLVLIAAMIIATLCSCKNKQFRSVYFAFLISSCKLFISDSFWYNIYFWGLLGLSFLYWRTLHKQDKSTIQDQVFIN